ncbi:septal ring lytic transglycosylase RlpA family protein [Leptolyngbya sp. FACHB-261]|nr:septal ring lytic transglycosylase RlpA family protein [Leptolyngbya sp. FACHB-261]
MIDAQVPQPSALEGQKSEVMKSEVTKVGARQSQQADEQPADLVARIQPHTWEGRAAATLYVRDIPIVTFLTLNGSGARGESRSDNTAQNPVWQATEVAARINALSRSDFDARSIALVWSEAQNQYQIRLDDQVLLGFAENVRLADATRNRSDDALQAANRLRRLLGNAPPLRQNVLGQARQNVLGQARNSGIGLAVRSFRVLASGIASWYGPGFHGNRSASGEVFNQNAMTAAHRSLPFGTRVRVVNRSNGRSVVVRITDRGPYARGRVIDLSTAAARVLGLVQSGVAPVRIEVLRR